MLRERKISKLHREAHKYFNFLSAGVRHVIIEWVFLPKNKRRVSRIESFTNFLHINN